PPMQPTMAVASGSSGLKRPPPRRPCFPAAWLPSWGPHRPATGVMYEALRRTPQIDERLRWSGPAPRWPDPAVIRTLVTARLQDVELCLPRAALRSLMG